MKRRYRLTDEELKQALNASKPVPIMYGPGGVPLFGTPQQNVKPLWKRLAKKYGFVWDSAESAETGDPHDFLATPL